MKLLSTFAENKELFVSLLGTDLNCAVTASDELLVWDVEDEAPWESTGEKKPKMLAKFTVSTGSSVDLLMTSMAERYPDARLEAEPREVGVFQRLRDFSEEAYYDFQEYEKSVVYEALLKELAKRGYELEFEI